MLAMASTIDTLLSVPTIVFVVGGLIAIVSVLATVIGKVMTARAVERTRREIAAYVAEGSIEPDKAIEMLKAGKSSGGDINL